MSERGSIDCAETGCPFWRKIPISKEAANTQKWLLSGSGVLSRTVCAIGLVRSIPAFKKYRLYCVASHATRRPNTRAVDESRRFCPEWMMNFEEQSWSPWNRKAMSPPPIQDSTSGNRSSRKVSP